MKRRLPGLGDGRVQPRFRIQIETVAWLTPAWGALFYNFSLLGVRLRAAHVPKITADARHQHRTEFFTE
ncbi:hypothetical protein [Enterovirga aerilata]|uniref:Uncharacterized protein n=1 Tax=Enterovirga aerilata TaxID=2730920 RepID=A0A849I1R4_9HYPH|nr:hypothetical protein [Enterovirga sp. DB1703]NNM73302.1 hypothetical protein [Enterovirga sp. DB1703]